MPASHGRDRPRVLLTNGEERSMLAACRSLHRAGYDVGAASFTALAPTRWSRSCRWRPLLGDAREDAEDFIARLGNELARNSYAALIPGSDSALLAISAERERLPRDAAAGLPAHELVERALNREQLTEAAREVGVTPPSSLLGAGAAGALSAARELGFPVALKSSQAARRRHGAVPGAPKSRIVRDETELLSAVAAFGEDVVIQRVVPGETISVGGVIAGGTLRATAVARYGRMWPPPGGSVTFAETIIAPAGLEELVERLLEKIGWEGIFELELIHSRAAGEQEFTPIDFNPRPYGSMTLAAAAGAPLAAIWCDWLLGRAVGGSGEPIRARPGWRYRWEDGDLRHLGWQLGERRPRGALAALRPRRRVTHALFALDDPLPLVARGAYLAKEAIAPSGARSAPATESPAGAGQ